MRVADNTEKAWYAMRVTYRQELDVQEKLKAAGVRTFIPMHYELKTVKRRKKRVLVPVIHSLLFVYSDRVFLQKFKEGLPHFQYIMSQDGDQRYQTAVPEKEMEHFISLCSIDGEALTSVDPTLLNLKKGQKVRILEGPYMDYVGTFMRIKGARDKRFVVSIEGVAAVAIALVNPEYVLVQDEKEDEKK